MFDKTLINNLKVDKELDIITVSLKELKFTFLEIRDLEGTHYRISTFNEWFKTSKEFNSIQEIKEYITEKLDYFYNLIGEFYKPRIIEKIIIKEESSIKKEKVDKIQIIEPLNPHKGKVLKQRYSTLPPNPKYIEYYSNKLEREAYDRGPSKTDNSLFCELLKLRVEKAYDKISPFYKIDIILIYSRLRTELSNKDIKTIVSTKNINLNKRFEELLKRLDNPVGIKYLENVLLDNPFRVTIEEMIEYKEFIKSIIS